MAYREQVFHELCIECRALAPHVCSACGRALCERHHRPSGCSACRAPKRARAKKQAPKPARDYTRTRQNVTDALVLTPPLLLAAAIALFTLIGLFMPIYAILRS
ncbi:MAG: hypothetical protein KC503_28380 [Myxococcales bacterium]|nr:hypothetical protein [Myxococcales bacterium]